MQQGTASLRRASRTRPSTFDQLPDDFSWKKVVLLLGNEGDGLSAEALQLADYHVQIEMEDPLIDSLGVAHAAAVAFATASNARKSL
jgi:tRNA G18 (ribose-2'-O)-methylase SpoU